MTPPPPITFAGKGASTGGHRRGLRRKPAPAAPRRVSGPTRGRSAARAASPASAASAKTAASAPTRQVSRPKRPAARPSTRTTGARTAAAPAPRRVSGPARGRAAAKAAPRRHTPLGRRAFTYVRALPDHRLIDRLIQSRGWIPVLGLLLVGIVFMQVEVLKLNANMGRAIESGTALQSRNELLRDSVATLSDDQRIESLAAQNLNMVMPPPDAPSFLSSPAAGTVAAAIANIHAPDPATFTASLPVMSTVTPTTDSTGTSATAAPTATTPTASTVTPAYTPVVAAGTTTTSSGVPAGG
jgi:cell division protein FtsL